MLATSPLEVQLDLENVVECFRICQGSENVWNYTRLLAAMVRGGSDAKNAEVSQSFGQLRVTHALITLYTLCRVSNALIYTI